MAAAALVVAGVVYLTGRGSSDTALGTEWSVSRESLLPGTSGFRFSEGLDGTGATTPFVVTDEVWVVQLVERYSSREDNPPDQLFGIDPDTGRTVWQIDLPGAVCADDQARDGTLSCLSEKGDGWQRVQVDPATGTVTEPVPVDVREPRQAHLSSAGLLVLSESDPQVYSQLSLLADDGSPTWSHDLLDLVGGEALFRASTTSEDDELVLRRGATWTDVGTSVLLGDDSFVHIRPADDTLEVHHGSALSVVDDHFFYNSLQAGAVGYDATGKKLWFQPDVELMRTADRRPGTGLLHVGNSDGALRTVDPATGELSPSVFDLSGIEGTARQSGPAEDTYLVTRNDVLRLSTDRDAVRWRAEVSGMNTLSQAFTVGEVTVVDTDPVQGLVAASGEESWTAEEIDGDLVVIDDQLVAYSAEDIRVLTLP